MTATDWPSLSIIITSLNRAQYIERLLLSILRQDYPAPVQTIVADGGSTDGTVDILRKYGRHITWWSRKDGGIVDAIGQGSAVATGQLVAFQDSDNFYLPDAFRHTVEAFRDEPDLAVATGCDVYLQEDGQTFRCSQLDDHEVTPRSLLMRRVIPIHCALVRRDAYNAVGGFRPLQRLRTDKGDVGNCGIDIDLWCRLLPGRRARFVSWHTCVYQHHADMMSRNTPAWYSNLVAVVEDAERDPRLGSTFGLSDDDKRNLYIRWEILQEHLAGNTAKVKQLVAKVMQEMSLYTEETRNYLRLCGLLPPPQWAPPRPRVRHPHHRDHDMDWWRKTPPAASHAA